MNNSHRAIIKGNIYRKDYHFSIHLEYRYGLTECEHPDVRKNITFLREETLWEGELDLPIMKSGDRIYISDLDLTVNIKDCLRTTDNDFIYSTWHTIETIEDEKTESSKLEAEKAKEEYLKMKEEKEKNKKPIKQPWYKRLFK